MSSIINFRERSGVLNLDENAGGFEMFRNRATTFVDDELKRLGFHLNHREEDPQELIDHIISILSSVIKIPAGNIFLEIGSGASAVARGLVSWSTVMDMKYVNIDSSEMIAFWPPEYPVISIEGRFPDVLKKPDVRELKPLIILAYSVLHYAKYDHILEEFIESALGMLKPGGVLFLGDVPLSHMKIAQAHVDHASPSNLHKTLDQKDITFIFEAAARHHASPFIIPQPHNYLLAPHRAEILLVKHLAKEFERVREE